MQRLSGCAPPGLIAVFILIGLGVAAPRAQEPRIITIGTGPVTGVYYPTGGAICRLVNLARRDHGIRCSVESTAGSIDNVGRLRAGEVDLAVVQSDVQHQARRGKGPFQGEPAFRRLRSLFSAHAEPLTVVARADAGIATLRDLAGQRVGLGAPGSAARVTLGRLMTALRWTPKTFAAVLKAPPAEQVQALIDDRIDAAAFVTEHPNSTIEQVTRLTDSVLIDVTGGAVERLVRKPFYAKAVIPGATYPGSDDDVESFGVRATLVTTADLPDDVVYEVIKAVFANLDDFRQLHPAFAPLVAEEMTQQALSARLHPGARLFYEEAGLQ